MESYFILPFFFVSYNNITVILYKIQFMIKMKNKSSTGISNTTCRYTSYCLYSNSYYFR